MRSRARRQNAARVQRLAARVRHADLCAGRAMKPSEEIHPPDQYKLKRIPVKVV
jgi:hypothetical protein